MQRLDLLMIVPRGNILRRLNCFLRFECEFVEAEHVLSPSFAKKWGRLPTGPKTTWQACISVYSLLPIAGGIHANLHLARLGFLALRQVNSEDAILIFRANGLGIYRIRQRKAAAERTVGALHTQVIIFRDV